MSGARGQANLPALALALLIVTASVGVGFALADGAFASARRDPGERRAALALAERLTAPTSPLTTRANVIARSRLASLTPAALAARFPVVRGHDVRLRLSGVRVEGFPVASGDPAGGTTVRRIVLVERRQAVALPVRDRLVTLPRRSPNATLRFEPGANVTTVRANDRIVLHDREKLDGTHEVALSRYETTTLALANYAGDGRIRLGRIDLTYYPSRTTKAELVVTVG